MKKFSSILPSLIRSSERWLVTLVLLVALPSTLLAATSLRVGNVVFIDNDGDGHYTQGVDDAASSVTVKLFLAADDPLTATPQGTTATAANGTYLFQNVAPGSYKVFIPPSEFQPAGRLYGFKCLPANAAGDDDVGQDALPDSAPELHGISTGSFVLSLGAAPTTASGETGFDSASDDSDDGDGQLTIDLGFFPTVAVGNLVFADANGDGIASAAEGKPNVWVELYLDGDTPGIDPYVAHLQTGVGGRFLFTGLQPGYYQLFIPPSEFAVGAVLEGASSIANTAASGSDDDVGEDGIDDAQPATRGIATEAFPLFPGLAPTAFDGETGVGYDEDDLTGDTYVDLTRDLGFIIPNANLSVGNLVFIDADGDHLADPGEGVDGIIVQLFASGANPQSGGELTRTTTANGGRYIFVGLTPGSYFIQVPSSQFAQGQALYQKKSILGSGADNGADDNADENGADAVSPASTGVSSIVFNLSLGTEPSDATSETGLHAADDNAADTNSDFTIDLGFDSACAVISLAPTSPPPATVAYDYVLDLVAAGGTAPHSFTLLSGSLPAGLSLSAAGRLMGTPRVAGSANFTLRITDAALCSTDVPLTLLVQNQVAIGNLIFFDANANGYADASEGVNGVSVALYRSTDTIGSTTALAIQTTANGGRFLFDNLASGSYKLHVPAAMFANGAPLYQMLSMGGSVDSTDDDAGEDGLDALDPSSTGVVTAAFTVTAAAAPTAASGENGQSSADDNARDNDVDLTHDLGFADAHALPATYASWLTAHSLAPGTLPTGNADADTSCNLLEYALQLDPNSGLPSPSSRLGLVRNATSSHYDFSYTRRRGSQTDLTYIVELLANLSTSPAGWAASSIVPTTTVNTDGTETLTYASVDTAAIFSGLVRGFIRLTITADTNGDTTPDATTSSLVYGWQQQALAVRTQTSALSFLNAEVFSGSITSSTGSVLSVSGSVGLGNVKAQFLAGREYSVEVTSGSYEGQRWEVDEVASTASTIALLPSHARSTRSDVPTDIAGASIVVVPHARVNDLFPAASFRSTNSSGTADQIMFYDRPTLSYITLWNFSNAGNPRWITGIAFGTDAGTRVVSPTEGIFARARLNPVTLYSHGIVRPWDVACPLAISNNFISNPWPTAQTPNTRSMTFANGSTSSPSFALADRINVWSGDTTNTSGYTSYFIANSGAIVHRWVRQGDLSFATQANAALFAPSGSTFIISILGKSNWLLPAPWVP